MKRGKDLFAGKLDNSDESILFLLENILERMNTGIHYLFDGNDEVAWFHIGQCTTGLNLVIDILKNRKSDEDE